jgi:SPOR domain
MYKTILLISFVLLANVGFSQTNCGTLHLSQGTKITQQVELYQQQNELLKKTKGYRVQIHFGSNRTIASEAKTKFMQTESKHIAYEIYQQPNYKVRVGDFRTRIEAYQFLKEIHTTFPNSFLVEDDINFPPLN